MIPTNKATGSGIGLIARLVIQFDYLLPDSIRYHGSVLGWSEPGDKT